MPGPALRPRPDQPVGRRLAEDVVARVRRLPAGRVAVDDAQELAAVGQPDVAVDVERADPADVPRRAEPLRRRGREPAPVRRRGVAKDLLRGHVDDVEVVEVRLAVAEERPDRRNVVAPLGGAADADPGDGALAGAVRGTPAPDDVPAVDHEEVAPADGEQLRRALRRAGGLVALAEDRAAPSVLEVDPVDRLRRRIEDERRAVGALDDRPQVDRRVVGKLEERRIADGRPSCTGDRARRSRSGREAGRSSPPGYDRLAVSSDGVGLREQLLGEARVGRDEVDAGADDAARGWPRRGRGRPGPCRSSAIAGPVGLPPPSTNTAAPRPPTTTTRDSSATAARRCISRRALSGRDAAVRASPRAGRASWTREQAAVEALSGRAAGPPGAGLRRREPADDRVREGDRRAIRHPRERLGRPDRHGHDAGARHRDLRRLDDQGAVAARPRPRLGTGP